ncbi:hypothetical protein Aperf_G00000031891 [Anoplocephala perfoliata]
MVKGRPSRSAQSVHESRTRLPSPGSLDCARHITQVGHEEKCDLNSEKSFLLSPELPITEIDAVHLIHNRHSRFSSITKHKTQKVQNGSVLRLPRTNFTSSANFPQHYVLISNKSLDLPVLPKSNGNNSITVDLIDVSAKELAEREATVNKTIRKLKAKGLWMNDRLPKVMEPEWLKCHWDYLLDEALWLAEDFRQERLWKKAMARRFVHQVEGGTVACLSGYYEEFAILAREAALAVMIRAELVRREALKLELLRERGAAKVAQLVREWWSGVSKASDVATLLSEHHTWQSALQQNRFALTQLTDTTTNWFSSAISRFSYPPTTTNSLSFPGEDEADVDYTPPRSSSSSVASECPEIVPPEESSTFNPDDFEWGLQSETPFLDSFSSQQSEDDDVDSVSDNRFSTEATSEEDLAGLRADAVVSLREVLESALDNGWKPQEVFSNSRPCTSEMDSSSADFDSPYQSMVNSLRHEATLPLRQLLPPGYHPISTTTVGINGSDGVYSRRRHPSRRSNRPTGSALLNGCSTHEDSSTNDSVVDGLDDGFLDGDGEMISPETSLEYGTEAMEVDGCRSDSEQSAASSLLWNTPTDAPPSFTPLPPAELARRARGLSSLRVKTTTGRLLQCRLPSFGPTCRVPFLPTPSLYSGVSWLSSTYAQRVPTCLISYSVPSADAALCLAVHIGQLAVSNAGDWGPHLVVTPRLLLPTWRTRLATVCPGLRLQCVLASARGGTGRRLKAAAAQRAFHVCLTTYSALRLRPSRFEGIQWHLVILDQVQHLIDLNMSPHSEGGAAESDQDREPAGEAFVLSTPTLNQHNHHHHHSTTTPSFVLPDLVHTLIQRLLTSARQRVCIFSATDVAISDLCEANGTPLKILFSLLLLNLTTADGDNAGNLIEDAVRQASLIRPELSTSITGEEVMAALEPFLYRFFDEEEEDDEDFDIAGGGEGTDSISVRSNSNAAMEKLIRFKFLSDHLTAEQRDLHDKLLLDRVCTRASRSGHLSDLLTCLSMGVRLCLHPWLLASQDEALDWLSQDCKPGPSPPCPVIPGLRFDSPTCLLAELRKENADSPIPLLSTTLRAPTHIRNRILELLPSSEHLKTLLASPKSTPVQIGKRRGEVTTTERGSQLLMKIPKMEGLDALEEQNAFISEETYRLVQLEEAKANFKMNKGISSVPVSILESLSSTDPSKSETVDYIATANLSPEAKSRLHILESQRRHARLELEDQADWCSSSTMKYIQDISREPSLFPTGINVFPVLPFIDSSASSTSYAICRVAFDRLNGLPSLSSPYSLYCTRDRAIALPAQLADVANGATSLLAADETLDTFVDRLYPLLPLSRWIASQTMPHHLAQFLAASGKIQRLRELLLGFVRTSPETKSNRPRVVFLISHYGAFLDLLATWLSVDPFFVCLPRIRAPIDHLDSIKDSEDVDYYYLSGTGAGWIERVNDWPCGTRGPLIVLMHGRAPLFSVAGLRAGPDTRVIVCDAEWRQEVHALTKSKLRCWSINGLVDVPPQAQYSAHSMPHRLQVYRLITEWDSGESIEARLLKSSAIHLLPDSVFKTAAGASTPADVSAVNSAVRSRISAASANVLPSSLTSSTSSRVQPNVVKKLFSKLRRRAHWRTSEKSEALPMPSMDSDEGEDEVTTQDEESDNSSLFHNREPVQKQMLTQCFDLHEAPRDVQAWCSSLAENVSIIEEMHGDEGAVPNYEEFNISDNFDQIVTGDFDALCQQQCTEINLVPPDVRERWEMDEASWQANFEAVEEVLGYSDPLFYTLPPKEEFVTAANGDFADENDLPITDPFKLPTWVPSFFNDADFCKEGLPAPYDKFNLSISATKPCAKTASYSDTRWGYSSEPMSESELPPLPPAPTPPLFDSTNTTAAATLSRGAGSNTTSSVAGVSSAAASSYALKRSAAAALSARNSVGAGGGGSSAPPAKKRKLAGAAAMAAKRSANNKAAAAAALVFSAVSGGRTSHLEGGEKSLLGVPSHDRSDLLTTPAASSIVSTPSATTTAHFTLISGNQKVCLPRPFFTRDARAVTGSASALQSGSGYGATSGGTGVFSSSYFTPPARIRRITAGVSSSSRLGGISGAGGVNMPGGGAAGVYAALNNPHLHAKYAVPTIGKPSVTGASSANVMSSAQRQQCGTGKMPSSSFSFFFFFFFLLLLLLLSPSSSSSSSFSFFFFFLLLLLLSPSSSSFSSFFFFLLLLLLSPSSSSFSSFFFFLLLLLLSPSSSSFFFFFFFFFLLLLLLQRMRSMEFHGPIHTTSGMVSFKFSSSGHVATSFNDVKPPEWTPLEEAALLMYTNKILETSSAASSSHHHHSTGPSASTISGSSSACRVPNFRLAETCVNAFTSMRAYRNACQCLIAYCRISSAVVSSSAADLLPHPLGDDDKTTSVSSHHMYQHHHHHQAQHGVGRKVKNKMKSGMSTPLIASSTGLLHAGVSLGVPGGDGDSASPSPNAGSVNKLRGYQHFLYLQSQLKSLDSKSPATSGASSVTAMTTPTSSSISTLDAQAANIMRRCIRDCSLKHPTQPAGKHPLQFHPSVGMGTASATSPAHHLQASGQVAGQRSGVPATTATMIMRNAAAAVASAVAGGTPLTPGSQQQLAMPATVIQKNPSHIAALQEYNISPDNLITPAMVIKNKEEREARQRAEAANAAAAAAASLAVGTVPSTVTVMASTPTAVGGGSGVPGGTSAAVVVGSGNHTTGVVSTARVHHHAHQHPTIVTISGTGGSSASGTTGPTIPRSANILPFSTTTSVSYHGGSGGSPTVFRYTTPGTGTAGGRQAGTTATTTGILRRVGPSVIGGGGAQSVFAVTPASGTGATHVISNTGGTAMMRRSVTLAATGVSQASGVSATGGGLTVLATASGARPGSVIYQHHPQGSTGPGTPTGITLLPTATAQGLPQIIRPRQQFRAGTPLSAQRFVRTYSATPASTSPVGSASTTPTTTTLVHRTRDGLYAPPSQQQQSSQQRSGASGIVIPEPQILLQRIPNTAQRRATGAIQSPSVVGRHQQQHQQPPSSSRQ